MFMEIKIIIMDEMLFHLKRKKYLFKLILYKDFCLGKVNEIKVDESPWFYITFYKTIDNLPHRVTTV